MRSGKRLNPINAGFPNFRAVRPSRLRCPDFSFRERAPSGFSNALRLCAQRFTGAQSLWPESITFGKQIEASAALRYNRGSIALQGTASCRKTAKESENSIMENQKNILCYGDSNTFGTNPTHLTVRHPYSVRWTGRLQSLLGDEYRVIEEGMGGRTTVWDDALEPARNGLTFLPVALTSHRPLDLVILSLGTNDCKSFLHASPRVIARGAERLIETIQGFSYGPGLSAPKILLVSPIHMGPGIANSEYASFDASSGETAKQLAPYYAASAERYGCAFLDAASVAGPGPDELHMDADGHRALAEALAPMVRELLK